MTMPTAGSRLLEFAQKSGQYPIINYLHQPLVRMLETYADKGLIEYCGV